MSIGNVHRLSLSLFLLLGVLLLVVGPGEAQTFGSTVNVSKTRADSVSPSMAASGFNVYLVWSDKGGTPFFSRSANSGASFSPSAQILAGQGTSAVEVAAAGTNVYATWSARLSPKKPSQIFFRRSGDNGATFASQIQVSDTTTSATLEAMAVSGNNVYIVWRQTVGVLANVFFARSIDGGMTFDSPVNLSNPSANAEDAVVAADGTDVHVVWTERSAGNAEILYRRSVDRGATFSSPPTNISNTTSPSVLPALAVVGSSVYVSYKDDAGIMFSCSLAYAGFSAPISLSGAGVGGPSQIAATGNDVHVIWHHNPGGNWNVFYARSNDGCFSFSPAANISNSTVDYYSGVLSANGPDVYVTWSEALSGEIYLRHSVDHGANFQSTIDVSLTAGGSSGAVTVAAPGEIHLSWVDQTSGNAEVLYRHGTSF